MSTKNENLFVKLIKKSVGLPTGKSDCCGLSAEQSKDCCGADASQSSSCGCGNEDRGGTKEEQSGSCCN